jgi:hypothetical protein
MPIVRRQSQAKIIQQSSNRRDRFWRRRTARRRATKTVAIEKATQTMARRPVSLTV